MLGEPPGAEAPVTGQASAGPHSFVRRIGAADLDQPEHLSVQTIGMSVPWDLKDEASGDALLTNPVPAACDPQASAALAASLGLASSA